MLGGIGRGIDRLGGCRRAISERIFRGGAGRAGSGARRDRTASRALFCAVSQPQAQQLFAGADIREFASIETSEQARDVARAGQELFARIAALPAPTVAIIQGVCLGGGLEMALACKYRVAVDSASTRLGLPETELGILPGWGGTQRLPRLVGEMQAISMILQARKLTASAARRSGLVDLVVSPESLDSELGRITTQLAETGSLGKPIVKRTWMGWFLNETRWGRSLVIGATQKNRGAVASLSGIGEGPGSDSVGKNRFLAWLRLRAGGHSRVVAYDDL
ncbi:MAG: enoyl-CoA hydratase-related protein [Planctomycetaceae bacterium]